MDAVGLEALLSDAVVADQQVGKREDLLLVGRVGQTLLVACIRCGEYDFAASRS